ncbi:ISH14-type transposase ISNamo7 [Natronomonas moolapensis 8.8.11]|uniref:ISH14-type transposase ISNamo7 n=1 Tax=Natronomonas moolapensis (strain DSM 18674 / CECT 7526 / JCM 14361 / 8.8.11) TaxID=268739 RepID=M1XPC2_NATM8|nr:IS6-like element ISNamo7 family transposase [Natronomonas moolapensis]CCQ35868.1 ISH14-type transposase ISNamo7 [Natronomonas moolapensis 8.8.11]CCQ36030.1 ISH14-type transposase ISNamo7 [Natronomonas moolapensis 8.8.11]CCQ37755.1 ISH14-type transposase ISNamo7 [Natronomonas moolapensis 8.8.11]
MPKNARLNGHLDEIELGFVEREATPKLLMKLGIQLHLAGLSLSNTISILEIFGVSRARSTVHNWVHRADLQPESGRDPDHVAVDETVIRLNDEQYWLYAAVDPETNKLLYTTLEPTTNKAIAHAFFAELREKHDVDDAVFLIDGSHSLKDACRRHSLDFRYERHGNRNSVERVFREVKRRTISFSNCFSNAEADTADDWLRSFAFAWNQLM